MSMFRASYEKVARANSRDECFALALAAARTLGFSVLTYDYAHVPRAHTGEFIPPDFLFTINAPGDFQNHWFDLEYYKVDRMWQTCVVSNAPFVWISDDRKSAWAEQVMDLRTEGNDKRVFEYLKDARLRVGATVPVHLPAGGVVTFTTIADDPEPGFVKDARHNLSFVTSLALQMQDRMAQLSCDDFVNTKRRYFQLTTREIECLQLSARGLTTEQIAERIFRSHPTAALHLNNAIRKLGAHNRSEAIALAAYYRLLD
jgi:LuxR family transcriptional regulator